MAAGTSLLTSTVTLMFTDIEGSTRLWEQHPQAMEVALARHDALLRASIEMHGGCVFKTMGDQFCAAFATAPEALAAAVTAQRALQCDAWEVTGALRVRMALHTGSAQQREGDYFGPPLNRVARLLEIGPGGQVLLSLPTHELVCDRLPGGVSRRDLGERRLKDLGRPDRVFQLLHPELPQEFPPLAALGQHPTNLPAQPTPLIGRDDEPRFDLLETIRDTDWRLSRPAGRRQPSAGGMGSSSCAWLEQAELQLRTREQSAWLARLESEHSNLRAALA